MFLARYLDIHLRAATDTAEQVIAVAVSPGFCCIGHRVLMVLVGAQPLKPCFKPGRPAKPCTGPLQGAAEMVLARCTSVLDTSGSAVELTGERRSQLEETITEMASRGLRTLCLSYRDISAAQAAEFGSFEEPPNSELVCCCICGIKVTWCSIRHGLGVPLPFCLCWSD